MSHLERYVSFVSIASSVACLVYSIACIVSIRVGAVGKSGRVANSAGEGNVAPPSITDMPDVYAGKATDDSITRLARSFEHVVSLLFILAAGCVPAIWIYANASGDRGTREIVPFALAIPLAVGVFGSILLELTPR